MQSNIPYKSHIFVCTNERTDGNRPSCGEVKGMLLVAKFKKLLKDHKLNTLVRAQRTGCFDFCEYGPMVVVYPEGIVYGKVNLEDVHQIVEQHIINGIVVESLLVDFKLSAENWLPEKNK